MSTSITAQDILADIEFELAQGAISRDDLGRGIMAIKEHQSKLRADLLRPEQSEPRLREALAKQFQMNDMLLTLLQETAAALNELKLQSERAGHLSRHAGASSVAPEAEASEAAVISTLGEDQWRDTTPLREAAATVLEPETDLRAAGVPLVGTLLQRLRHAAHSLVIFYLGKLGRQQQKVNSTYSDWLLYQQALHRHHAEENVRLRLRLQKVEGRLQRLEGEVE